eukprot:Em0019g504a
MSCWLPLTTAALRSYLDGPTQPLLLLSCAGSQGLEEPQLSLFDMVQHITSAIPHFRSHQPSLLMAGVAINPSPYDLLEYTRNLNFSPPMATHPAYGGVATSPGEGCLYMYPPPGVE